MERFWTSYFAIFLSIGLLIGCDKAVEAPGSKGGQVQTGSRGSQRNRSVNIEYRFSLENPGPVTSMPVEFRLEMLNGVIDPDTLDSSDFKNLGNLGSGQWSVTSLGDGQNFLVTFNGPSGTGTVFPSLREARVQTPDGRDIRFSCDDHLTVVYDDQTPRVSLQSMTFSPSLTPNFTIQVQFSEPVSGFQPSDLILQNAVLVSPSSGVLPTQSRFQIIVSAINSGPVGVSLPRNKVLDSVGNGNEASNAVNMIYAPAVVPDEEMNYTISLLGPNVSNDFRSVFEVNFEDPIDGSSFSVEDIQQAGTLAGVEFEIVSITNQKFEIRVVNKTGQEGTIIPSLGNAEIKSAAQANLNLIHPSLVAVRYDEISPRASLSFSGGFSDANPTTTDTVTLVINFSEAVTGFSGSDLSLSNATVQSVTPNNQTPQNQFQIVIKAESPGQVSAQLPANSVIDIANNTNPVSNSVSLVYQIPVNSDCTQHFTGGSGTSGDPFKIADIYGLQCIKSHFNKHFILDDDVDASESQNWDLNWWTNQSSQYFDFTPPTDVKGFAPIDFQGSLNGAGFKIVDLYIESSENNVGLFKTLSGMVEDMEILDPQIKGESYVGALAGQAKTHYSNRSPVIRGVTLRGGSVEGAGYVGGLVGNLEIPADDIQVKETQIVASASYVGGLFGRIKNQSFRNLVFDGLIHVKNTQSVDYIGGFFSWSSTHSQIALEDSYSSGNIIVDGDARYVGGLAGRLGWYNYGGNSRHLYHSGSILIKGHGQWVGGIAGLSGGTNDDNDIRDLYNQGAITIQDGGKNIGGLFGQVGSSNDDNQIHRVFSTGSLNLTGDFQNVGGLIGRLGGANDDSTVSDTYSTTNIALNSESSYVGGLIGWAGYTNNPIRISKSYASGDISARSQVGGLLGLFSFTNSPISLSDSFATGDVSGTGTNIGSLAGVLGYIRSFTVTLTNVSYFSPSGLAVCGGNGKATDCPSVSSESEYHSFSAFDYGSTWRTDGGSLPTLQCPGSWPFDCSTTWNLHR